MFKPLNKAREKTLLSKGSYDSLSFFKDVLIMLLDLSIDPALATTHNSLIETLLLNFCDLLEDEAIISKTKSDLTKEPTTVLFILKIFLASTQ